MNTRFAVATHILTVLHMQAGEPVTSEILSSSINTNASLVRRLLMQLAAARLTRSQMGAGGGALLARPANRITLLDVFRAVVEEGVVIPLHQNPNPACPVGRNIATALDGIVSSVEQAMEAALSRTTIADLTAEVLNLESRRSARR
ncbi:Rrf2 family transcriptional regulator [Bradyrhizobium sp. UFLA05-112]